MKQEIKDKIYNIFITIVTFIIGACIMIVFGIIFNSEYFLIPYAFIIVFGFIVIESIDFYKDFKNRRNKK